MQELLDRDPLLDRMLPDHAMSPRCSTNCRDGEGANGRKYGWQGKSFYLFIYMLWNFGLLLVLHLVCSSSRLLFYVDLHMSSFHCEIIDLLRNRSRWGKKG